MGELFGYHHSIILLLEPGGATLRVVASRGYENQAIGGRVRVGIGAVGIVAQRRKILQLDNLGQQRAYASAQRRQMVKSGMDVGDVVPVPGLPNAESQIAIPLLIRDELVGVFSIESPKRQAFDEHDRSLVTIVANQIATAIRNAQLYDERRRAADALQAANASLEARVAERTAALERELRVAEELLSEARNRVDGPLLGDSEAVRALRDAISREAPQLDPLLLVGPPGSGKEAVARALHDASSRRGAFIFVRCAELQTDYRQTTGSLEGTSTTDEYLIRKLDLASGGTLFLEAVHELPLELQRSLHTLVQRRNDVRVVASTTHDLHRDFDSGRIDPLLRDIFRSRLSVPALADRRADLAVMVDYFLRQHAKQLGKIVDGVSPASMRRLEAYSWPGNIRELRTVVERAVLVSRSSLIEIDEESLDARV